MRRFIAGSTGAATVLALAMAATLSSPPAASDQVVTAPPKKKRRKLHDLKTGKARI